MSTSVNLPWWSADRPWGFRFSRSDLVVVLAASLATLIATRWSLDIAVLIPFVLGHFFLFCNVFRVGEVRELIWSGLLLLAVTFCAIAGIFSWWIVIPLQGIATLVVIVGTLRSPDYHGVCCQRVNPLGYRVESRRDRLSVIRAMLAWIGISRQPADGRPSLTCINDDALPHSEPPRNADASVRSVTNM